MPYKKRDKANRDPHLVDLNLKCVLIYGIIMTDNILEIDKSESPKSISTKIDRRMGVDRRNFSYHLHIPERRAGKDRRSGKDRRKLPRFKDKYF